MFSWEFAVFLFGIIIVKNVNKGHDIRVGNGKQRPQIWGVGNGKPRPQLQNYKNISQQNPNPHQKTTDFREIKKSNNILILTDSMLKTLGMSEFNKILQEGKAYLNRFPEQKQNNLIIMQLQF